MSDTKLGLFARWSQRRQQVEEANEQELAKEEELVSTEISSIEEEAAREAPTEEEARLLTSEDLPDPDKIEVGGSFAEFMGNNVDPQAKTDALRALWKQPHFNELDGLVEYGLDYSNQPKLSPQVSAELAQKVFRHILKDEDEEQDQLSEDAITQAQPEVAAVDVANLQLNEGELTQDNLTGVTSVLSQNEPEQV